MQHRANCVSIVLTLLFLTSSNAQQDDFPVLKGPYLGLILPEIVDTKIRSFTISDHGGAHHGKETKSS
jgi:hypothetical protein